MNRKEKDIVRAYFRAVKYASQIESRVRIMLIGDEDSGNTHRSVGQSGRGGGGVKFSIQSAKRTS